MLCGEVGNIVICVLDLVMFLCYWCNKEVMCEKFVGDFLFMGDLGNMDEVGYICYLGCNDDVIISVGYCIGFVLIEECLMCYLVVWIVVVVGVKDVLCMEVVKVFVVL